VPILGIMASAMSANLWQPEGAYDSLATVTLSAATSSITFAGIPSTYKHLQIRAIARNTVVGDQLHIRLNSDSTANYTRHELSGFGASANAYASTGLTQITGIGFESYSSVTASTFGATIIDILDYTNTNKNKTVRSLTGYDYNGGGGVGIVSGLWINTSAITSIVLNQGNSGNFDIYSSFALYGVK
jgi:hypothetical protein